MPKIRIRELDRTAGNVEYENDIVVFVVDANAEDKPKLLVPGDTATDYSEEVKSILNMGGKVVVCNSYANAKPYLKDRNQFDIKFLMVDEDEGEEPTFADLKDALEIAGYRRDCAVVYSKITPSMSTDEANILKAGLGGDDFLAKESGLVGKYCLPFYGKSLVSGQETYKAGLGYILAFLKSRNDGNAEWLAVAGSKRGSIPAELDVGFLTEDEIDAMQPRVGQSESGTVCINPIVKMNPWGIRIWGNRTALVVPAGEGLTASHFANIRVLICDIKKQLYKSARQYQFEQNNDVLWVNFQSSVNTLLEEMVQSYGITGYKWIREENNERAKLKAILRIIPIEPVEDFDLTLELVDSLEVTE